MKDEVRIDLDAAGEKLVARDVPLRLNSHMVSVSGARHVRDTDDWTVPLRFSCLVQLMRELKGRVDVSPSAEASSWAAEATQEEQRIFELITAMDADGNILLTPLQRSAVRYVEVARRGILGYDMGGGKTVICAEAVAAIPSTVRNVLVVCPKGVMRSWERHFHEWSQDVTPIVASDSAVARRKAIARAVELSNAGRRVALIMNYESAWRHSRLAPYGNLRMERCAQCDPDAADPVTKAKCETCAKELNTLRWDLVIADEAHRVINVSKQTRGLWYLTRQPEYVWALTGTPTRGSIADFWSLLHLVDPVAWSSKTRYVERYCTTVTDAWGNERVVSLRHGYEEEFAQVTQRYMIRRSFDEIMMSKAERDGVPYLPFEVLNETREVEMTKEQRSLYDTIAEEMFVTLPSGEIVWAENGLTKMTRLLQCASATLDIERVEGTGDDEDGLIVHMVTPSSKVSAMLDEMRDLPEGEPVIVFTLNRDLAVLTYEAFEKEGYPCSLVHGGVPQDVRDEEVVRFQEGHSQVIILTYATGAEGIDLQRSRIQFRPQLSWSMILNEQSVGRNRRYGQKNQLLTYVDFVTANTVESRVHEAYADKLDALEAIVGDAKRMKELVSGK